MSATTSAVGVAEDTLVLTSDGWRMLSTVVPGMHVYNQHGYAVPVVDTADGDILNSGRLIVTDYGRMLVVGVNQKVNAFRAGISCGVVPDTLIKDYGHSYAPWHFRTDPLACIAAYEDSNAIGHTRNKFPFKDSVRMVSGVEVTRGLVSLTVASDDGVVLVGKAMLPVVFKIEKSI